MRTRNATTIFMMLAAIATAGAFADEQKPQQQRQEKVVGQRPPNALPGGSGSGKVIRKRSGGGPAEESSSGDLDAGNIKVESFKIEPKAEVQETATTPVATVKLNLIPNGAKQQFCAWSPQEMKLDDERPEGVKQLPTDLINPLYGKLKLGRREAPASFYIVLEAPSGKQPRLLVDSNSNGDLTDDPAPEWKVLRGTSGDREIVRYRGVAVLKVDYGTESPSLSVMFEYHPDSKDPQRAEDKLLYYGDYARAGNIKLGDKTYRALLFDMLTMGDYRGRPSKVPPGTGICLRLDLDGDGRFYMGHESVFVTQPFNIGGTTYEIRNMTPSGSSFDLVKSSQTVPEMKPSSFPRRLPFGAPPFEGKTLAGKSVRFPEDYRGKLVLLHCWSSKSEPCIEEIPDIVAAYNRFRSRGLDVLGVNLEEGTSAEQVVTFAKKNKMSWPQIYDGNGWKTGAMADYYVGMLPWAILIDADTGVVRAFSDDLHGADLAKYIDKELARKKTK